jgi:hypothetical protein
MIVGFTSKTDQLCLWVASGNSECVQLSRLDLQLDVKMKTKVTIFNPVILNFCDNCYLSVNFPHFNSKVVGYIFVKRSQRKI